MSSICSNKLKKLLPLAIATAIAIALLSVSTTQAQFAKTVIVVTGQDAPGIPGAKFSSSYPPQGITLSDDGKALILGHLEHGVGGINFDNEQGFWLYEADSLRLLAHMGGIVPGFDKGPMAPGNLPQIFLSPNGQLAMQAEYADDSTLSGTVDGFFIEEGGVWVEKMYSEMTLPTGDELFAYTIHIFNNGRALFSGGVRGPNTIGSQDAVIGVYGPEGINVISQSEHAIPEVPGDWLFIRTTAHLILTAAGKTVFETQAGSQTIDGGIGVVLAWDPVDGHVPIRISGIDSTFIVFGNYHLNSQGNTLSNSWDVFPTTHGLFDNSDNLILGEGAPAPGTNGLTFDRIYNHALFDDNTPIFQAVTSDGKTGIWAEGNFGIQKVARVFDPVPSNPNRPGDYVFWRVNNMEINRKGQIAFSDLVIDTLTDSGYVGVWMGSADEPLQLVIESDERVEVFPDSFLTIEDAHIINESIPRTGADGSAAGLNNNGEILLGVRFTEDFNTGNSGLVIARPGGLIVNTTTDSPDADTTDGICSTGNKLPDGRFECSLRAAIMEANSTVEPDTIRFGILGEEIPVILPTSALPAITQPVTIDGTTQLQGFVEISGASSAPARSGVLLPATDGLNITTDNVTLNGLIINRFTGNGVTLEGGSGHSIWNCVIGTNKDEDSTVGNAGHGVFLNGSTGNLVGGPDPTNSNTIAFNAGSGVFIESGVENQITQNEIFSNKALGIDLDPAGVNPNDSGDTDAGANNLQNYPTLDSLDVDVVTTLWGTINGQVGQSYQIDVYQSDNCDTVGYGEGKTHLESAQVSAIVTGTIPFTIGIAAFPERGKYLSATATDAEGNTSEFSRCMSASFHLVVDDKGDPIKEKKFAVYKVKNDRPTYTEAFVDTVKTDKFGIADLTKYKIPVGDSLRFTRALASVVSPKRASTPKIAYSVDLDNAQFDSASSVMSYSEASEDAFRDENKVKMTHTTVAYNLYVSIEFDATVAYINNLRNAFRQASNYLYDVTDGQSRIDTVFISDNKLGWNIADVWVFASNMEWPRAFANALMQNGANLRFYMPRKFYGNTVDNRNKSAVENPLNPATSNSYRTFIHELGHYAFGFYDEYVFTDSAGKCGFVDEYGFMEKQYAGTVFRSEMSYKDTYGFPGCDNTAQFTNNGNSCWETFQRDFEKGYDGIIAPIIMPDERELPGSQEFLLGPNDDLSDVDVNVGAKVVFLGALSAPGIPPKRYRFFGADNVTPMGNVTVLQLITATGRWISQGNTSDDGHLYFMGAPSAYSYRAAGVSRLAAARGARSSSISQFAWSYGDGVIPDTDTGSVFLAQVEGAFPLIPSISITGAGLRYSIRALNQFSALPSVTSRFDNAFIDSLEFTFDGASYNVDLSDTLTNEFELSVLAIDAASKPYFFNSVVSVSDSASSGSANNATGAASAYSLSLDTSAAVEKTVILTTYYPPIRRGLDPSQLQAGQVGVIQTSPSVVSLSGFNSLEIRYQEGSEASTGIDSTLELSLRIHRWDESGAGWKVVGGLVDTVNNVVSSQITELGTYALFTTDIQTDIGDGDGVGGGSALPKSFEVQQNFPNPFNPTTVISYSLPVKAKVTISIFNILGQTVKVFDEGEKSAGLYEVTWDASDESGKQVASGIYFYKVSAGKFKASRKMLLLK